MLIFRRKNMTELTAVFVKKAGVYVNYEQNFPPQINLPCFCRLFLLQQKMSVLILIEIPPSPPPLPLGGVIGQNIFYWKEETLDVKEECTEEEDPLLIKSPSSEGKQKDNFYFHSSIFIMFKLVFRILFILIWIRIRGSTSGNKGSGFGKKFLYLLTCRGICQDPCWGR